MDSTKQAVGDFLSGSGKHVTDVDESVNPAVTSETIRPHRHEETTEAIDREVHQHHYHTTVQPLQHREVLPEQHQHQVQPVQERTFQHGDIEGEKSRAAADLAQFQSSSTVNPTQHSSAQMPVASGEHVHHHVHENVQPIIHKETVQPEVVHTTVPIHETHHAPAEHHGISQLPTRSLQEFTAGGGSLAGTRAHQDPYEGHPKQYNPEFQLERKPVDIEPRKHDGTHDLASTGHNVSGSSNTGTGSGSTREAEAVGAAGAAAGGISGHHTGTTHHGYDTGTSSLGADPTATGSSGTTERGYQTGTGIGSTLGDTSGTSGLSDTIGGHHGSGNSAAMGAGVAGVGAGAAAADLARDHRRAGDNTDMTSSDVTGPVGDSATSTTGTALAGRGAPNTSDRAHEAYNQGPSTSTSTTTTTTTATTGDHHHLGRDTTAAGATGATTAGNTASTTDRDRDHLPTTSTDSKMSEATEQPSRGLEAESGNKGAETGGTTGGDDVQHGNQPKDPAVEGDTKNIKMTGSGTDGSHSAVFGLTPDGHKHTDTSHGSTAPKPAHSEQTSIGGGSTGQAVGGGKEQTADGDGTGNTTSQGVSGAGVAEQMHDPRVAEKGHGGSAVESEGSAGDKPGAGTGLSSPSQGTGDVKPAEHDQSAVGEGTGSGGGEGSMMGKLRSYVSGS